jgi:transposase InsO family protein
MSGRTNAPEELALRICTSLGNTPSVRRAIASALGKSERTLRRWQAHWRNGQGIVRPRGRPPTPVSRSRRQQIIAALVRLGPCAGVPVMRGLFGDVPYRAIAKLKRRFVGVIQKRCGWYRKRLLWTDAGSVWATDFTHPKAQLPGDHDRLFLVRDLASGAQLAAVPCKGERALVVCAVLTVLFALGSPLVLKHDGGGAFLAKITHALLQAHDVRPLRSPPYTPQYNGACERSGGTLKKRIAHEALLAGHPARWTNANIAQATQLANTTARPRGANGSTPAEAFTQRRRITPKERRAFKRTRDKQITRALKTHQAKNDKMPTCTERAAILRKATQHALCKHGYLTFRRGRISTPVSTWKADIKA